MKSGREYGPRRREVDSERLLTSREAARQLGVGPSTIKRWADNGILICTVTAGGHRRFDRKEVERLRASGPSPRAGLAYREFRPLLLEEGLDPDLLTGALFAAMSRLRSWWRVADSLGTVLNELGTARDEGTVSISEIQRINHALSHALGSCAKTLLVGRESRMCRLATCEGDSHTLGLSLAELCAREAGWQTDWIGGPVPTDELVSELVARPPDMLAVSASSMLSGSKQIAAVHRKLAAACLQHDVLLVVGGRGSWPSEPSYGYRMESFADFHKLLVNL